MEPIDDWLDHAMPTIPHKGRKGRHRLHPVIEEAYRKPPPQDPEDGHAQETVEHLMAREFPRTHSRMQEAEAANVLSSIEQKIEQGGDMVNLPAHYARFKIEPIHFIGENGLDWFQGNIVKYTLRHDAKNGLEDLKKARRYVDMYIAFKAGDPDWWRVGKPKP